MKIKIFTCIFIGFLITGNLFAQMAPAKRLAPAIEKKTVLNASPEKVWEYISQPNNYQEFSGIKSFKGGDRSLNSKMEITGTDGKKRSQYISVLDFDNYRICYFVTSSDYLGEENWIYAFNIYPQSNGKSEVVLELFYVTEKPDRTFKQAIQQEFDNIVKGLNKKFKTDN